MHKRCYVCNKIGHDEEMLATLTGHGIFKAYLWAHPECVGYEKCPCGGTGWRRKAEAEKEK